jgi:hypothetical protein
MAIVVENGTGLTNAVSYFSVANADAYFLARGIDSWADEDDATKEVALVRATFGLDQWLRGRWKGVKKTQAQSLAWPRVDALDSTTGILDEDGYELSTTAVPTVVEQATAEVALIELTQRFVQQSVGNSNSVSSETVGPISVSYFAGAPSISYYPHVEALLRGVAASSGIQLDMTISLTAAEIAAQQGQTDMFNYPAYFNLIKWP